MNSRAENTNKHRISVTARTRMDICEVFLYSLSLIIDPITVKFPMMPTRAMQSALIATEQWYGNSLEHGSTNEDE